MKTLRLLALTAALVSPLAIAGTTLENYPQAQVLDAFDVAAMSGLPDIEALAGLMGGDAACDFSAPAPRVMAPAQGFGKFDLSQASSVLTGNYCLMAGKQTQGENPDQYASRRPAQFAAAWKALQNAKVKMSKGGQFLVLQSPIETVLRDGTLKLANAGAVNVGGFFDPHNTPTASGMTCLPYGGRLAVNRQSIREGDTDAFSRFACVQFDNIKWEDHTNDPAHPSVTNIWSGLSTNGLNVKQLFGNPDGGIPGTNYPTWDMVAGGNSRGSDRYWYAVVATFSGRTDHDLGKFDVTTIQAHALKGVVIDTRTRREVFEFPLPAAPGMFVRISQGWNSAGYTEH